MLVVGGGYIGLEMASVYSSLGAKIDVVEFLPRLLPGADADLVGILKKSLEKKLNNILLNTKVVSAEVKKNSISVTMDNAGESIKKSYEKVLVSVGRVPNTDKLMLNNAGIKMNENNFIIVDEYRRTNIKNIFAIGDVTGNPMLAHKATHEGKVAAEVASGIASSFEPQAIPAVIFTDPEISWAGYTEEELIEKNIPFEKAEFPWQASGKALSMDKTEGKTKILFKPEDKRIIGVGIVGHNAGDLIGESILAIEMGADAEDIGLSIHPHPTLSESVANTDNQVDEQAIVKRVYDRVMARVEDFSSTGLSKDEIARNVSGVARRLLLLEQNTQSKPVIDENGLAERVYGMVVADLHGLEMRQQDDQPPVIVSMPKRELPTDGRKDYSQLPSDPREDYRRAPGRFGKQLAPESKGITVGSIRNLPMFAGKSDADLAEYVKDYNSVFELE